MVGSISLINAASIVERMSRPTVMSTIRFDTSWHCWQITKFENWSVANVKAIRSNKGASAPVITHHCVDGAWTGRLSATWIINRQQCSRSQCRILPNATHRVVSFGHLEPISMMRICWTRRCTENAWATLWNASSNTPCVAFLTTISS